MLTIDSVCAALLVMIGFAGVLFLGLEIGHRLGLAARQKFGNRGSGVVEAAVLGLLGLMLAFSLDSSKEQFGTRRQLLVESVNAGTAVYDRILLLPEGRRENARRILRTYADRMIIAGQTTADPEERLDPDHQLATALQHQLWITCVEGCGTDQNCAQVLLPAVNKLADWAFARIATQEWHKPTALVAFLFALAFAGAILAGYSVADPKGRRWVYWALYVVPIVMTLYLITELEFPRWGLIRIRADVAIDELLQRMAQ